MGLGEVEARLGGLKFILLASTFIILPYVLCLMQEKNVEICRILNKIKTTS
jgi:hypothetical protein